MLCLGLLAHNAYMFKVYVLLHNVLESDRRNRNQFLSALCGKQIQSQPLSADVKPEPAGPVTDPRRGSAVSFSSTLKSSDYDGEN